MARHRKPIAGSRAYWPKSRAKRTYPRVWATENLSHDKTVPVCFAGYKAGMTNVTYVNNRKDSPTQGQEVRKAATIIDCPPLTVCGIKIYRKTEKGLADAGIVWAENLSKDLFRKSSMPGQTAVPKEKIDKLTPAADNYGDVRLLVHANPRKSGFKKKRPEVFEVPLTGTARTKWHYAIEKLGKDLRHEEVLKQGEFIDAIAIDNGKGFEGVIARYHVKHRHRKAHGKIRHVGSLGPWNPSRVLPGKLALPGQLGYQRRTEYNKRVLRMGTTGADVTPKGGLINYGVVSGDYVLIEGSVPGPKKRLIMLRLPARPPEKKIPVEVRTISLESQQGL
jgi:large subunit ribosomal protein L3